MLRRRGRLTGWRSKKGSGPELCLAGTPVPGSTLYMAWGGIPGTGGAWNLCNRWSFVDYPKLLIYIYIYIYTHTHAINCNICWCSIWIQKDTDNFKDSKRVAISMLTVAGGCG
jgi:hypothetical protein